MHGMPDETISGAEHWLAASERLAAPDRAESWLAPASALQPPATPGPRTKPPARAPGATGPRGRRGPGRPHGPLGPRRPLGPHGPRWLRPAAGWAAGAVLIGGLAWLLMALITDWTSYPLLNVTSWRTLTYGPRSAQVSFVVHNSGNAEAGHCVAYLRLGPRRVLKRRSPAVPAHGTGTFFVTYRDPAADGAYLGYAWAACDGAIAPRQQIPTVRMVSLVSGSPQVLVSSASTTVRFQVRNLGSRPARGCHAYLRLSTGVMTGGDVPEPELGGRATADFSVRYDPAVHPGIPAAAWADCTLTSPG
jgi:hypothetical protein